MEDAESGGPVDDGWTYVPLPPDTRPHDDLGNITVDGQTFSVRSSDDGSIHYSWITGPNDGYGFSILGASNAPRSPAQRIADIRDFLAGIDPETGYLSYP